MVRCASTLRQAPAHTEWGQTPLQEAAIHSSLHVMPLYGHVCRSAGLIIIMTSQVQSIKVFTGLHISTIEREEDLGHVELCWPRVRLPSLLS